MADIRLSADRDRIGSADGDLAFIAIECIDRDGRVVPVADMEKR